MRFPERIFPRFKSGSQLSFPNFLTSLLVSYWPSSLQDVGDMSADNSEEVLNEFKFLTQSEVDVVDKGGEWNERSGSGEWGVGGGAGAVDQGNLELGELEQLTINNENDLNYDQLTAPKVRNTVF